MMMNLNDDDDVVVDMAPLIDCVFLLLIFFLVATVMKKPELKLPVDLPEPAISGIEIPAGQSEKIGIDKNGIFYWNGAPLGKDDLYKQLEAQAAAKPDEELLIDADRNVPARFLVQVMDLCSFHGLKNYSIHTLGRKYDQPAPPKKKSNPKKKKK